MTEHETQNTQNKQIKNGIQLVDAIIKVCEARKDHKEIDYGHQMNPWARPRYND